MTSSLALLLLTLGQATATPATPTPDGASDGASDESPAATRLDILLVQGAGGTEQYQQQFQQWTEKWRQVAETASAEITVIGVGSTQETPDREQFSQAIRQQLKEASRPLWIVMIGHGTDDRRSAKFNMRGPDITARWLAEQLKACERPLAVLCCFSSSGPFLNQLSDPGRVVVTATRSGAERNYSRFGKFLADALTGDATEADLDKDEQTSLLEAFLLASKRTEQFYADENRLATEHALLDDNGDHRGTPADWFHGIRPVKAPKDGQLDGFRATQMVLRPSARERDAPAEFTNRRDLLERQIAELRSRRDTLEEQEYYRQLEQLLVPLAELYQTLE